MHRYYNFLNYDGIKPLPRPRFLTMFPVLRLPSPLRIFPPGAASVAIVPMSPSVIFGVASFTPFGLILIPVIFPRFGNLIPNNPMIHLNPFYKGGITPPPPAPPVPVPPPVPSGFVNCVHSVPCT